MKYNRGRCKRPQQSCFPSCLMLQLTLSCQLVSRTYLQQLKAPLVGCWDIKNRSANSSYIMHYSILYCNYHKNKQANKQTKNPSTPNTLPMIETKQSLYSMFVFFLFIYFVSAASCRNESRLVDALVGKDCVCEDHDYGPVSAPYVEMKGPM